VTLENLFDSNVGLYRLFSNMLTDSTVPEPIKNKIRSRNLGNPVLNEAQKLEEETIRYFLWLDAERSSLFFAKHIIICEGSTEKVFLEYLTNELWSDLKDRHIYFLDSMGKFNIHRYMNLFKNLGISHSILIDKDNDTDIQGIVNKFLSDNINSMTKKLESFPTNFEAFLGIAKPPRSDLKPLNALCHYRQGKIKAQNLTDLRILITGL
jgi:predicted ATP-dependent endonuclease of OLD family